MKIKKKLQDEILQNHTSFSRYSVWIDVSKNTLDVCILREDGKVMEEFKIQNSAVGIKELESRVLRIKDRDFSDTKSLFFLMESTGSYHIYPALTLKEKWFTVKVFNPIIPN